MPSIDGRGAGAPAYEPGALSPEKFEREFCDVLMETWVREMPRVAPPSKATPAQARTYHATYLKYFSSFAWNFPSWLMNSASRCPYQDMRITVISDCVDEEVGDDEADGLSHIELLYRECEGLGVPREEVTATEPTGPILTALQAFENLSRQLSWLASFAAVSALEIAQAKPAMEARVRITSADKAEAYLQELGGQAFHEILDVPAETLAFFAHHAYKDQDHGGNELALIVKHAYTKQLQDEVIWAVKASVHAFAVMSQEIVRLCHAAAGLEIDPDMLTQL